MCIKEVVVHGVCLRFRGVIIFVNRDWSSREQGDSSAVCCIPATGRFLQFTSKPLSRRQVNANFEALTRTGKRT